MRALLPEPGPEVDLVSAYAIPARDEDRPFVRCNMISSFDGAIALNGRSGGLGGTADRRVFRMLRALADVVLVGAGTVRGENYGPARLDEELRALRQSRGQPPVPPIAVVTRSGNLDWESAFFTQAEQEPIVFVPAGCDSQARRRGERVARMVTAGSDRVSPVQILEYLQQSGYRSVLLEGGPGLNADIAREGMLDELCLTLSPRLVGGHGPRLLAGEELPEALGLGVLHLLEEDGFLFLRLAVQHPVSR